MHNDKLGRIVHRILNILAKPSRVGAPSLPLRHPVVPLADHGAPSGTNDSSGSYAGPEVEALVWWGRSGC